MRARTTLKWRHKGVKAFPTKATGVFIQQLALANNNENIKGPHRWSCASGIKCWLAPYNMAIWSFACHKVMFLVCYGILQFWWCEIASYMWQQWATLLHFFSTYSSLFKAHSMNDILQNESMHGWYAWRAAIMMIKWKLFPHTGPLCGEFTSHRWIPLTKASDAELWCFLWSAPWINGWVNNREAGYLRRHHAHYDVIVMLSIICNDVIRFVIAIRRCG